MFNLLSQIKSRLDAPAPVSAGGTTDLTPALDAIAALDARVQGLSIPSASTSGVPAGWVQVFHASAVPDGYVPLDGRDIAAADNPALYAMFGDAFGPAADELTARATAAIITPDMTSNTAPSGVASASSEGSTSTQAWEAFNRVGGVADGWQAASNQTSAWLQYALPAGQVSHLVAYAMRSGRASEGPTAWTMSGSNDGGATWTVLDGRQYTGWNEYVDPVTFELDSSQMLGAYNAFRITMTDKIGSYYTCGELQLIGLDALPMRPALPEGRFRVPDLGSSPATIPGGVWCIKAG